MELVTLDFETHFDKDYTLKKLTTEEYVRDSRFKVHCVGMKLNNEKVYIDKSIYESDPLHRTITKNKAFLCHHAHFDGLILSHYYGTVPAFWFDTLSMARMALPHLKSHSLESLAKHFGLPSKIVPYDLFIGQRILSDDVQRQLEEGCRHDVELTYEIFKRLLPLVPKEELRIIDMTIRMFTEPKLELDRPKLEKYLHELKTKKEKTLSDLNVTEETLASSAKFKELLEGLGVEVPMKQGKNGLIPALSKTDEGMKGLLEHEKQEVQALAAARLGVKSTLNETRTERLLSCSGRGKLPIYLKYYGAHTGRWSGGDKLNWQNFPRGGVIRQSVLAPSGHTIVVADLAQIEARVLAWLARQEDLIEKFKNGRDVYSEFASVMYGRTITKESAKGLEEDKKARQIAKSAVLGAGYGMGATKFEAYCKASGVSITSEEAKETIALYRKLHADIKDLWYENDNRLSEMILSDDKRIDLPNGCKLDYTTLGKDEKGFYLLGRNDERIRIWGGTVVENLVQALARIILSQAMLKISKAGYNIINTIHDEIWVLIEENLAEEVVEFIRQTLKTPPEWGLDIPLDVEVEHGRSYCK